MSLHKRRTGFSSSAASSTDTMPTLLLSKSTDYSGLSLSHSTKFATFSRHPLYNFPVTSSEDRLLLRSAFTSADHTDLKASLASLQEKSPFQAPPPQSEASIKAQTLIDKITETFKKCSDLNDLPSCEEAYMSYLSINENPIAELLFETEESLSYIQTPEPSRKIDDEPTALASRVFLNGSTASKCKLLKNTSIDPPDLHSPLLRKVVVCCEDMNAAYVESRDSTVELKHVKIMASFGACGYACTSQLELSKAENKSRGVVFLHDPTQVLIGLLPMGILKELSVYGVKQVSTGYEHIVALTDQGKILSWGYGASGCLGHGDLRSYNRPSYVVELIDKTAVYIECGGYHTATVTDEGNVWTWGRGDVHQLGVGISELEYDGTGYIALTPIQVAVNSIKTLACGEAHTLVLDSLGRLFSFGWGEEGQLGVAQLPDGVCSNAINQVKFPYKLVRISAGAMFSAGLTENGTIFVWGNGENGQLGLGNDIRHSKFPALVGGIKHECVIDVVCGESHVFCLTSRGEVWGWGKGVVGDFEDPINFPPGSDVVCFLPRKLNYIDITHRFIAQNSAEDEQALC